jgi:hypothetical protein
LTKQPVFLRTRLASHLSPPAGHSIQWSGGGDVTAQAGLAGVEDRLRDVQSITDAALSRLDDRGLLAELLERTKAILQADTAAVLLLDFSSGQLIATAAAGLEEEVRQGVRIPVGRGFAGRIAAEHRPVILDHVDHTTVLNPDLVGEGDLCPDGRAADRWRQGDRRHARRLADATRVHQRRRGAAAACRGPGSGLQAAVTMGRVRSALRAYALETCDPAEVLAKLDAKMQHFEPGTLATVLYAVFDPGLDRVHICSAGHYPPIIASGQRPAHLAGIPPGLLIGAVPGAQRQTATLEITPGTSMCFYTDGLIERRDRPIDHSLARLCQAVTPQPPDAACAAVMAALVGSQAPRDDIALLILWRHAAR